ncbi:MAG: bifunctional hydroxymethylpyrimidine kinase/phosphomethylpyrimidine kinase, partial [Thermoplasmatales archaeon]|nr:bifunctional hydroxymethylpyrimidine kinase/phosphomethylpyrimidine kinase [Thermoplasmatales archaeon]
MKKKIALSIAGSDPSSGAGIQADLKSFSFLGLHGTTVVTCITSQNTRRVKKIHKLPVEIIENQIDVLFEDFNIDAVKTGMLYDEEIIKCVVKKISEYKLTPVVDPVMIATSGDLLSQNTFVNSFKKYLLPKTFMLTANIPEACELTGLRINSIKDFKKNCQKLLSSGPKYVLIKGGHLDTKNAIDVLYDSKNFYEFSLPRIPNKKAHGSGCTLSAIITGLLALGETPVEAVRKAKYIIWDMINQGYIPGKGSDILNHSCEMIMPSTFPNNKYFDVWFELKNAIQKLVSILPPTFVPEVGMNFAYAVKNAQKLQEICAVNGRIFKTKDKTMICGDIDFGSSKHVASVVLAAMSVDKNVRSAANICYSKNIVELCKKVGFSIGSF